MIVDVTESNKAAAVDAIAALEAELFGRGAWNANMVREELDAPARTYVLDVDDAVAVGVAADAPAPSRHPDGAPASPRHPDGVSSPSRHPDEVPSPCGPDEANDSSCGPDGVSSLSCRPERAERAEGPHGTIKPSAIRGYAGFWYDGEDAEIMTIGVAKEHQRQGIAASMLAALIAKAREQGARRMLLEVRVDNDPALALYRRFGFERMGLRKRYYQPEGIDAYTMSLDLAPRIVGFAASGAPQTTAPVPTPDAHSANAPAADALSAPVPASSTANAPATTGEIASAAPHAITNATTNSITNGKTR